MIIHRNKGYNVKIESCTNSYNDLDIVDIQMKTVAPFAKCILYMHNVSARVYPTFSLGYCLEHLNAQRLYWLCLGLVLKRYATSMLKGQTLVIVQQLWTKGNKANF